MTSGEEQMGGRSNIRNMENALEALIAALYLDGGLKVAEAFILKHWKKRAEEMTEPPKMPKPRYKNGHKEKDWAFHNITR